VDSFWVPTAPPWTRRSKSLVEDFEPRRALRAFEAATITAVRQGLRNGSLYSPYGEEFADPTHHLMPAAVWQTRRGPYQLEKSLPQRPEQDTDRAQAALQASLAGLQDAVATGDVWIGRKDLYFRRDEAEEQPEGVDLAHTTLYREIGRVQLPTLLLELDARVVCVRARDAHKHRESRYFRIALQRRSCRTWRARGRCYQLEHVA
jgi:hypothetical protein